MANGNPNTARDTRPISHVLGKRFGGTGDETFVISVSNVTKPVMERAARDLGIQVEYRPKLSQTFDVHVSVDAYVDPQPLRNRFRALLLEPQ